MPDRKREVPAFLRIVAAMALGGFLGVAWTMMRHRRQRRSDVVRRHRFGRATLAAGLLVVAGGAITRTVAAFDTFERCPVTLPAGTIDRTQHLTAISVAEEAATWVPTGIGMWDAYAFGEVCWIRPYRFYVGVGAKYFGGKYLTLGDIFLAHQSLRTSRQPPISIRLGANTAHESRHRAQWAVGTVVGGPLAFPVVYTVTDLFFPGARNPFERMAGLKQGNYNPYSSAEPVLKAPQIVTLLGAAAVLEILHHSSRATLRHRRERALRSRPIAGQLALAVESTDDGQDSGQHATSSNW
jgi:hypothetical protein